MDVLVAVISGDDDDPSRGKFLPDRENCFDPAEAWQAQVHQCDVRLMPSKLFHRIKTIARLGDNLQSGLAVNQCGQPGAQGGMVVHHEDANGFRLAQLEGSLGGGA